MRKPIYILLLLSLLAVSCEEWDPVLYGLRWEEPIPAADNKLAVNTSIAALKQLYLDNRSKPVEIKDDLVIGGQVTSSDRSGNVYRELYIQDGSGAISVKIGKSSLYSDYHPGQWVYVRCKGLTLGSYSGMPQLGVEDETDEYETAYIDAQYLIDEHIVRGRQDTPPAPVEMGVNEITEALAQGGFASDKWGRLVTLKGLRYGAPASRNTDQYKRIFALLYIDQSKNKKEQSNRVFLSDKTYGVTTWAMSKNRFIEYLDAGNFDGAKVANGDPLTDAVKQQLRDNAVAVTMSHYFSIGTTPVQIRTSGYARFADTEIDAAIRGADGASTSDGAAIDVTGILTLYDGAAQFTLIDLDGVRPAQ